MYPAATSRWYPDRHRRRRRGLRQPQPHPAVATRHHQTRHLPRARNPRRPGTPRPGPLPGRLLPRDRRRPHRRRRRNPSRSRHAARPRRAIRSGLPLGQTPTAVTADDSAWPPAALAGRSRLRPARTAFASARHRCPVTADEDLAKNAAASTLNTRSRLRVDPPQSAVSNSRLRFQPSDTVTMDSVRGGRNIFRESAVALGLPRRSVDGLIRRVPQ